MEAVTYTILGIRTAQSKKGTIYSVLYLSVPFNDYEQKSAVRCEGSSVITEYVGTLDVSSLEVGDSIRLLYSKGYEGKAVISGISKN